MLKPWFARLRLARKSSTTARRAGALRRLPAVEMMETRELSSTFTVTNAEDNGNNYRPISGSLRAAILAADHQSAGTFSTIDFKIPGTVIHTIVLQASLPALTKPMNISGLSQPGSRATAPLIQLDGTSAGGSGTALHIDASASGTSTVPAQVSGLDFTDFLADGVLVDHSSYVTLSDDFVGVLDYKYGCFDGSNGTVGVDFIGGSHDTLTGCVVFANQGTGVIVGGAF
jgi:hypothetical protein